MIIWTDGHREACVMAALLMGGGGGDPYRRSREARGFGVDDI